MTTYALQRDRRQAAPDDFPDQLAELLAYLDDRLPPDHPFQRLGKSLPGLPEKPEPWLLGSSPQSAIWAAELGLPYAFADFINPKGASIAETYRGRFMDSERLLSPEQAVAVWAIAADSEEEARTIASSSRMSFKLLRQGRLIAIPPPEKAMRFLSEQGEDPLAAPTGDRRAIVGTPEQVREGIEQVASDYRASEVIVVAITYSHEARMRSYELIADAFGLTSASTASANTSV
jgi:luciferase family oxidoreductase group 1